MNYGVTVRADLLMRLLKQRISAPRVNFNFGVSLRWGAKIGWEIRDIFRPCQAHTYIHKPCTLNPPPPWGSFSWCLCWGLRPVSRWWPMRRGQRRRRRSAWPLGRPALPGHVLGQDAVNPSVGLRPLCCCCWLVSLQLCLNNMHVMCNCYWPLVLCDSDLYLLQIVDFGFELNLHTKQWHSNAFSPKTHDPANNLSTLSHISTNPPPLCISILTCNISIISRSFSVFSSSS